jgi:hypothetical protein
MYRSFNWGKVRGEDERDRELNNACMYVIHISICLCLQNLVKSAEFYDILYDSSSFQSPFNSLIVQVKRWQWQYQVQGLDVLASSSWIHLCHSVSLLLIMKCLKIRSFVLAFFEQVRGMKKKRQIVRRKRREKKKVKDDLFIFQVMSIKHESAALATSTSSCLLISS